MQFVGRDMKKGNDDVAIVPEIPTKLSQLENDIGAGGGTNIISSPTEPSALNAGDWWYKEI